MKYTTHDRYMQIALREAAVALDEGEVPVGAVVVWNDQVIGRAHNQVEQLKDATAHAEMIALTQAASGKGSWRLDDCTLYVTLEPCAMCAGAMVQSRLQQLVFGVRDWQQGGALSNFGIAQFPKHVHQVAVIEGILEQECKQQLTEFFNRLRAGKH